MWIKIEENLISKPARLWETFFCIDIDSLDKNGGIFQLLKLSDIWRGQEIIVTNAFHLIM